ncbi:solute carrier family 35 member E1 [Microdochium nivale]|nr:solute carrier family 35 member E1 [Microdochium nivale]
MPHSISSRSSHVHDQSLSRSGGKLFADNDGESDSGLEKFPDHVDSPAMGAIGTRSASPAGLNPYGVGVNGGSFSSAGLDRWQPRRDNSNKGVRWGASPGSGRANGHVKQQKSIGEALQNIRVRSGSVTQNAHELADALRAPISPRLVALCVTWYMSSALTNTSSKSILNAFARPASLTMIQFFFVAFYCLTMSWMSRVFPRLQTMVPVLRNPIRYPSRDVISTTLPLAAFQIGGHLLSSSATSKIPVSMVHTVKGLSPLFTVLAYRFIYDIRYPRATYYSLVPLTCGVMLACSSKHAFEVDGELLGLIYALLATLIFVTQNIFSKKLFNEAARAESDGHSSKSRKLDKLNLLCYSSGMAFILTLPIWFVSEGIGLIRDFLHDGALDLSAKPGSFDHGRLFIEFLFNGTFHFGQNILAFVLLSMVSPVTYSVASLIKRVWVIIVAIIWFWQPTTPLQAVGIALTAFGLYLYDRANDSNKADKRARTLSQSTARSQPLLPLNTKDGNMRPMAGSQMYDSPMAMNNSPASYVYTNSHTAVTSGSVGDSKKNDGMGTGRQRGQSNAGWLAPGTRQEETWRYDDRVKITA